MEEWASQRPHHGSSDGRDVPHAHPHGGAPTRTEVDVREHLLAANDRHAQSIRTLLAEHHVFCVNLLSSPGSGKTALLEATLSRLGHDLRIRHHRRRRRNQGPTPSAWHLRHPRDPDQHRPLRGRLPPCRAACGRAVGKLDLRKLELLVIENVGNLVCPAEFDIGEDRKVVLLSGYRGGRQAAQVPAGVPRGLPRPW